MTRVRTKQDKEREKREKAELDRMLAIQAKHMAKLDAQRQLAEDVAETIKHERR